MIWFVKMLWQMPRAMIEYRREYKQVQFVRRVRKQFNEVRLTSSSLISLRNSMTTRNFIWLA